MVISHRNNSLEFDHDYETLKYLHSEFKKYVDKFLPLIRNILRLYSCERCGKCCRDEYVMVTLKEAKKLKKFSGDKFDDYIFKDLMTCKYLKIPCPYLRLQEGCDIGGGEIEQWSCNINKGLKPFVCSIYPFIFIYGYYVSLALCPYGNKIKKDMEEFNNIYNIKIDEKNSDNKMSGLMQDLDNMYDSMGISYDRKIPMQCLNLPLEYIREFDKWLKKKYRKV